MIGDLTRLDSKRTGHPVVLLVSRSVQKMVHIVRLRSSFSDQSLGGGRAAMGASEASTSCSPIICARRALLLRLIDARVNH